MTGHLINLRRERKRRARSAATEAAEANRLVHGLTKTERAILRTERDAVRRQLDGHRLAPSDRKPEKSGGP